METTPVLKFKSHIEGRNADVSIYRDRIEWEKPRMLSMGKLTAGAATAGLSALATGLRSGKSSSNMIPMRQVTGVTTKRDGMINSKVTVITSGDNVEFRVSHASAAQIARVIGELIIG